MGKITETAEVPTKHLWSDGPKGGGRHAGLGVQWEQRGRSGSTRGLPEWLPERKEGTEDQPEGGVGGSAAGGEPGEAAAHREKAAYRAKMTSI